MKELFDSYEDNSRNVNKGRNTREKRAARHNGSSDVLCRVVRETDAAMLIEVGKDKVQHWIPLSAVNNIRTNSKTGIGTVNIDDWILNKKGILV